MKWGTGQIFNLPRTDTLAVAESTEPFDG